MASNNSAKCPVCDKTFFDASTKKRHVKTMHKDHSLPSVPSNTRNHVICPLCPQEPKVSFTSYNLLMNHLTGIHDITIEKSELNFNTEEEFENWMTLKKIHSRFTAQTSVQKGNGIYKYYNCNRSNSRGFESLCTKNLPKTGGTIKIKGICPSRVVAHFTDDKVKVVYVETHVGHGRELRAERLGMKEQEEIVTKLVSGVSENRILKDARTVKSDQLERVNLINRDDLKYLKKKYNIEKRIDPDEMVAVAMKVEEWNRNGKNYAFLYKKIGESHPKLRNEDFVLGFMNSTMERKLKDFGRIICMDGTHGTNRRKYELTTLQVRENHNAGFPVAFFLSNRQDQVVQEIYLEALKKRIEEEIIPEYFMTDDDGKFFNAWVKEMGNKPRRLLCSWHVVKNWNIQGKVKIKNEEVKKTMKRDLREIMTALKEDDFNRLTQEYFDKLIDANETDFLKYLKTYYFQSEERKQMWAYCHRINGGINTNMAVENLNKFLKYNLLEGNARVPLDKLLDAMDTIVEEKMWKSISNIEWQTSNNYQDKEVAKAHRKAEESNIMNKIEAVEFGKFRVKSSSGITSYFVEYNNVGVCGCLSSMCRVCEICIHRYKCECIEYTVKNTMCKHVHMVSMYERRMRAESVLVEQEEPEIEVLCIEEPSQNQLKFNEAKTEFIEKKYNEISEPGELDIETKTRIRLEELVARCKELDAEGLDAFFKHTETFFEQRKKCVKSETVTGRKRKIDKQSYYPSSKK